ncbi:hypothetical protein CTAYLR_007766 [Chrysophaeum taylorii]|uniref:ADP-ribosylation factor n=1 Tax=Chrysophaeum taylorii TaxID=2483200 RepID=A0AAD7UM52_9STRA|nr:hypothetical protein CTAYLR_007766 [Chrysophaeum taylorii]
MGAALARLWRQLSQIEARMVMVGLDNAGKTTILYKLKLAQSVSTIPTIGFNVESVQYRNLDLTVWDIGGQDKIRRLWRHYLEGVNAVVFVVDSHDTHRITLARDELHALALEPQLKSASFLIFANKQDLPGAAKADKLIDLLNLRDLKQEWFAQPCVAHSGYGLYAGMDWLARRINDLPRKARRSLPHRIFASAIPAAVPKAP